MTTTRAALAVLTLAGLALSAWSARPSDLSHIAGWRTSVLWASLGWVVILIGMIPWAPVPVLAIGVLLAGLVELFVWVMHDPLLIAAKPLYQVPPVIVGSLLACLEWKDRPHRI